MILRLIALKARAKPLVSLLALCLISAAAFACEQNASSDITTPTSASRIADTSAGTDAGPGSLSGTTREVGVVTTLYPIEYFARRIGGDRVTVVNLVPPGVEAHDFEPSAGDIRAITNAELVLYNGTGFEPWMGRALEAADAKARAIEVSASIADLEGGEDEHVEEKVGHEEEAEEHSGLDPHVWLDPMKAAEQAELVREALKQLSPFDAEAYDAATAQLLGELDALHREFLAGLADCRLDHFVSTHRAFAYLAKRYGLEQLSISGLSPEAEQTPTELARLTDQLKDLGVKHLLVEPNISAKQAETMAREIGAAILPLHPLESLTPDEVQRGESYFTIMRANLASLRTALDCK